MAHKEQMPEVADDGYNSASDEDFNPDAPQPANEEAYSSSSDDDGPAAGTKPQKRKEPAEDLDFDNSGDEATIAKAARKKRKSKHDDDASADDEQGGEGGLVKTRAQRKAEISEKKPLMQTGKASVDVDALWAQMSGPQNAVSKPSEELGLSASNDNPNSTDTAAEPSGKSEIQPGLPSTANDEATVTIKRSYEFAGQIMEEEKVVPASSAEAKLYLEEQKQKHAVPSSSSSTTNGKPPLRRPKKRTSILDNPSAAGVTDKGPKLNTLQKSKLDWAAHVDQEGISEELDVHRRAKDGYLGRMDFLGRMENKREDDLRNVRSK